MVPFCSLIRERRAKKRPEVGEGRAEEFWGLFQFLFRYKVRPSFPLAPCLPYPLRSEERHNNKSRRHLHNWFNLVVILGRITLFLTSITWPRNREICCEAERIMTQCLSLTSEWFCALWGEIFPSLIIELSLQIPIESNCSWISTNGAKRMASQTEC